MKKILLFLIISCNTFGMGSGVVTLRLKNIIPQEATEQTPAVIKKLSVTIPKDKSWKIGEMSMLLKQKLLRDRFAPKTSLFCPTVSKTEFELCSNALEIMPGETFTKYFNGLSEDNKGHLINGAEKLGAMGLTCQLMATILTENVINYCSKYFTEPVINYCFSKNLLQKNNKIDEGDRPKKSISLKGFGLKFKDFDWQHCNAKNRIINKNVEYYYEVKNKNIVDNNTYVVATNSKNENDTCLFFSFCKNIWSKNGLRVGKQNNFSNDGKYIVTTSETQIGFIIRKLGIEEDYSDFSIVFSAEDRRIIEHLLFCPNGNHLCVVSSDEQNKKYITMWDLYKYEELYTKEWDNIIQRVVFTPSGNEIIVISDFCRCSVVNVTTGVAMFTMQSSICEAIEESNALCLQQGIVFNIDFSHASVMFSRNENYCVIKVRIKGDIEPFRDFTNISIFNFQATTLEKLAVIYEITIPNNVVMPVTIALVHDMRYVVFHVDDKNSKKNKKKLRLGYITLYSTEHDIGLKLLESSTTLLEKYALYCLCKTAQRGQGDMDLQEGPTYHALRKLSATGIAYLMTTYLPRYQSYYNEYKEIIDTYCDVTVSTIKNMWDDFFHTH